MARKFSPSGNGARRGRRGSWLGVVVMVLVNSGVLRSVLAVRERRNSRDIKRAGLRCNGGNLKGNFSEVIIIPIFASPKETARFSGDESMDC